jgi:hypothetical protein
MQHSHNIIGRNVAKFRRQRGWIKAELLAKLQLAGCPITLDILASIEAQRCAVTDAQIFFFSQVFCISVEELFFPGSDVV